MQEMRASFTNEFQEEWIRGEALQSPGSGHWTIDRWVKWDALRWKGCLVICALLTRRPLIATARPYASVEC